MCELFAMSSRIPASVGFSLEKLARHGGAEGPHRDGWGVAFYEGRDVALLREPCAASESRLVQFIEQHAPPSERVISHIRRATHGDRALRNTQPFVRELGGRRHVFAHNGELEGIERQRHFRPGRFQAVGDTDSELVFCHLLELLAPLWRASDGRVPALTARLDILAGFAERLRGFGPANFIYSDADTLFVHAHRRRQADGRIAPPGLHVLEQSCDESTTTALATSGVALTSIRQQVVLVASVPLTDADWRPLSEGELLAIANGSILENRPGT